ncbi:hypothetical protein BLA29_015331, partial [Euroglyphus maynei]
RSHPAALLQPRPGDRRNQGAVQPPAQPAGSAVPPPGGRCVRQDDRPSDRRQRQERAEARHPAAARFHQPDRRPDRNPGRRALFR